MANLEYGGIATLRNRFKCGRKYSLIFGVLSVPWTFLICPVCQWPNQGEMQIVPWEQRFKNYMDREYNTFENSERMFYDSLTAD